MEFRCWLEFLNSFLYKSTLLTLLLFIMTNARAENLPRFTIFKANNCLAKKNTLFLSLAQKKKIESQNDIEINSKIIQRLNIECGSSLSHAYILNDRVRTHYQTLLIWVKKSSVAAIETIDFREPKQYQAPAKWIKSIELKNKTTLYKVDALSGATLTRQSTLKLVKKSLLFDQL